MEKSNGHRVSIESEPARSLTAADDHARGLLPFLRTLRAEGAITIGAVIRSLNERKIPTARGSR